MRNALILSPFALLLFILPFPGTVAFRLTCLALAFAIALASWKRLAPPALPCTVALGLWGMIALTSLAYAVDPAYSLGEIKNEVGYTMIAFIAFFVVSGDAKRVRALLLALAAGTFVLSAMALASRFGLGFWDDTGRYGGAGAFASYLIATVPALALLGLYSDESRLRKISIGLLAMLLLTGYFCLQRAIWPILFLQACVLLLTYWKKLAGARIGVALALLALAAVAVLALTQTTRHEQNPAPTMEMNKDVRLAFWPRVGANILEHPLSGAGFGREAMKKAYPDLSPPAGTNLWHAHNVVLNYGLSMGLPGMLALLGVFGSLAAAYARLSFAAERRLKVIGACGLALVIGVLARNMTNDFFVRDAALLFWALNGMLLGFGGSLATVREAG